MSSDSSDQQKLKVYLVIGILIVLILASAALNVVFGIEAGHYQSCNEKLQTCRDGEISPSSIEISNVTTDSITISWTEIPNVISYFVQLTNQNAGTTQIFPVLSETNRVETKHNKTSNVTFTAVNLLSGVAYSVGVSKYDNVSASVKLTTTLPGEIDTSTLTGNELLVGVLTLSWKDISLSNPAMTAYNIITNQQIIGTILPTFTDSTLSFVCYGLLPSTNYVFYIQAEAGKSVGKSVSNGINYQVSPVPTGGGSIPNSSLVLTLGTITSSSIGMTWPALLGTSTYIIQYNNTSGTPAVVAVNVGNVTSYTITGLASAQTYSIMIYANSVFGQQYSSNTVFTSTAGDFPAFSGAVINTGATQTSLTFQFADVSASFNGFVQYNIYLNNVYNSSLVRPNVPGSTLTITFTGLSIYTYYEASIAVVTYPNVEGSKTPFSQNLDNPTIFSTQPYSPTNLGISYSVNPALTAIRPTFTWTPPVDVTDGYRYNIQRNGIATINTSGLPTSYSNAVFDWNGTPNTSFGIGFLSHLRSLDTTTPPANVSPYTTIIVAPSLILTDYEFVTNNSTLTTFKLNVTNNFPTLKNVVYHFTLSIVGTTTRQSITLSNTNSNNSVITITPGTSYQQYTLQVSSMYMTFGPNNNPTAYTSPILNITNIYAY